MKPKTSWNLDQSRVCAHSTSSSRFLLSNADVVCLFGNSSRSTYLNVSTSILWDSNEQSVTWNQREIYDLRIINIRPSAETYHSI